MSNVVEGNQFFLPAIVGYRLMRPYPWVSIVVAVRRPYNNASNE